jgi:hypothetical protein
VAFEFIDREYSVTNVALGVRIAHFAVRRVTYRFSKEMGLECLVTESVKYFSRHGAGGAGFLNLT